MRVFIYMYIYIYIYLSDRHFNDLDLEKKNLFGTIAEFCILFVSLFLFEFYHRSIFNLCLFCCQIFKICFQHLPRFACVVCLFVLFVFEIYHRPVYPVLFFFLLFLNSTTGRLDLLLLLLLIFDICFQHLPRFVCFLCDLFRRWFFSSVSQFCRAVPCRVVSCRCGPNIMNLTNFVQLFFVNKKCRMSFSTVVGRLW